MEKKYLVKKYKINLCSKKKVIPLHRKFDGGNSSVG